MYAFPVLLGDIGGTNARFAVLPGPGEPIRFLPANPDGADPRPASRPSASPSRAMTGPAPRSAMIAVATRVDGPVIRLTNAHWTIDAEAIGEGPRPRAGDARQRLHAGRRLGDGPRCGARRSRRRSATARFLAGQAPGSCWVPARALAPRPWCRSASSLPFWQPKPVMWNSAR